MTRELLVCALVSVCALACGGSTPTPGAGPGGGGGSAVVGGAGGGGGDAVATTEAPPEATTDAGVTAVADDTKPPRNVDEPAKPAGSAAKDRPALDPVYTVKTTSPRDKISDKLVKPAKAAYDKRDWGKAIVYYQALVVARGPASREARTLADVWALAGDSRAAIRVIDRYIAASDDEKAIAEAREARGRFETVADDPFSQRLRLQYQTKEATKLFKDGRAAFKKKKYGDALVLFRMSNALDPDLPGSLRELGATYDKLGSRDRKIEFYVQYLVRRPLGKNADQIRKDLAKEKGLLASLTIDSSLPCQELWLNGQVVTGKLPRKITVAPGLYTGLCYQPKFAFIRTIWDLPVKSGDKATMSFEWALVQNALEKPFGRIAIENPDRRGEMVDLGIDTPVRGVVVPEDGRALRMVLKDDSGSRSEERFLKLRAGETHVIKW